MLQTNPTSLLVSIHPKPVEHPVGTVVMYASVSVDPGGILKVSQQSFDYIRPYWDQIGVTIVGRHVFDLTGGWGGEPPGGVEGIWW